MRYTKKKRLQDLFSRFQFKCRKRISISFQSTSSHLCPSHPTIIALHYSAFKKHQMTFKRLKSSKMDSERTLMKRHKDAKKKRQNVKITITNKTTETHKITQTMEGSPMSALSFEHNDPLIYRVSQKMYQ